MLLATEQCIACVNGDSYEALADNQATPTQPMGVTASPPCCMPLQTLQGHHAFHHYTPLR